MIFFEEEQAEVAKIWQKLKKKNDCSTQVEFEKTRSQVLGTRKEPTLSMCLLKPGSTALL